MSRNLLSKILLVLVLYSCESSNNCVKSIKKDYPKLYEVIIEEGFVPEENMICNIVQPDDQGVTLYGETEFNSKGYFFLDSATYFSLTMREYELYAENDGQKIDEAIFTCYEFSDSNEREHFFEFQESISRQLERLKNQAYFFNVHKMSCSCVRRMP